MKKLFIVSAIAILTTGSTVAFAETIENANGVANNSNKVISGQVTKPASVISSPPQKVVVLSGPVTSPEIASGPVLKADPPTVGSHDWMAQEKAAKDKLRTDAERKQASLEAEAARVQAELEAEISRLEKIAQDTTNLNKAIALTKDYVGKTWYVFSGSTPSGWDCSGLVLWTYAHLGVDLYHSAAVQKDSGVLVTEPKIGDIVSFTYRGSSRAFHTGIYVGPDEMLHSGGKRGDRTEITSISYWAKGNGNVEVAYTRVVETNN